MKSTIIRAAILLVAALSGNPLLTAQCMTYPVPIEQRVARSESVCLGKLTSKEAYTGPNGNIFTLNRILVSAWLKGHSPESEIGLLTWGGFLPNEGKGQVTEPSLQLEASNEYILFLEPDNHQFDNKKLRAAQPGFRQCFATTDIQGVLTGQFGKYHDLHYPPGKTEAEVFQQLSLLTGRPALRPNGKPFEPRPFVELPKPESVPTFSPSSTHGGTIVPGDYVTLVGSGFGPSIGATGNVYFKNVDDGGDTEVGHSNSVSDYTSWSPTSITVKVPPNGGTGVIRVHSDDGMHHITATPLTVTYGHSAVYSDFYDFSAPTRQRYYFRNLFGGPPETVGYIFRYNSDLPTLSDAMSGNVPAKAAFERALTTWRCGTGWNAVASTTTTTADLADDGISSVMFVTLLAGATVGRATSRYSAFGSSACDLEDTFWWLAEVDVEFELSPNGGTWIYTGTTTPNFESVAAHELGHGHGLEHVMLAGKLMSPSSTGVRYPDADELAAGEARMAYSTIDIACATTLGVPGEKMSEVAPGVCSSAVLPIELMRFHCETRKNLVRLNWETATELNNDRFEIERSADGEQFKKIGEMAGGGSSAEPSGYFFDDESPVRGLNFYRLRQVDFDGEATYSGIESAFVHEKMGGLAISPNPAADEVLVVGETETTLRLFSPLGIEVLRQAHEGGQTRLDLGGLPTGIYFLVDDVLGEKRRVAVRRQN